MKIGIYGYGNLGRGVELATRTAPDAKLTAVFTRRDPGTVKTLTGAPVLSSDRLPEYKDTLDILILCGGSATDLPVMTPKLAESFSVIDSFDTHARIPEHFDAVNAAALKAKKTALISAGWDPGMFSLARLYASAILPDGADYTFWGRGVSQGHSDAIRRIDGVLDARQYTVPSEAAMKAARSGLRPTLSAREKHTRECYVVAKEGADFARIEAEIKSMPNYFADYDTTVTFLSKEELERDHAGLPHGGSVIRTGATGLSGEHKHVIEYKLSLESNPEFTGSTILAFARAVCRMNARGNFGCKTVFDVAPADLSVLSPEELRKSML